MTSRNPRDRDAPHPPVRPADPGGRPADQGTVPDRRARNGTGDRPPCLPPEDRTGPPPAPQGRGATVTRLPGTADPRPGRNGHARAGEGRAAARRSTRGQAVLPGGYPGPAQLAPLARRLLADAVRVARWTGAVDRVDKRGDLLEADVRAAARALSVTPETVARDWARARLTGLVEVRDGGAAPGWRLYAWEHDDEAALRGWSALFDAWTLVAPVPADPGTRQAVTALAGQAVDQAPQLLSFLHLVDGPVPVGELLELLRRGMEERRHGAGLGAASPVPHAASAVSAVRGGEPAGESPQPPPPPTPAESAAVLEWMLDGMSAVGALVRCTAPDADDAPSARLSPLGHWAVRAKLEEICTVAQTAAGHIEQSAAELLTACARYSPGPARAEYRAWVAARPVDRAVAELLEVARGEDPLARGLAFEALRVVGGPAQPAVRTAVEEPVLRPYALLWLAEQCDQGGVVPADVLSREDAAWLWVDTGAAVLDHGDPGLLVRHVEAASVGDPGRLFSRARQSGHPRTASVLAAVASAHPDQAVARAARRSAFSVHPGGA